MSSPQKPQSMDDGEEPTAPKVPSSPIADLLAEEISHAPKTPPPEPLHAKKTITSMDPRLEDATKSVEIGDWKTIAKELGPLEKAGGLPPTLGLLCALAHHETGDPELGQAANEVAIRCMASLFGIPGDSPISLVLAKRLLRKNPVAWRERPAPPAKTSFLIVAATLVIGSALGWLLSAHPWTRFHLHL